MKKIVIIGGGAAGVMAAITAKKENSENSVLVLEKNERPMRKVMITGKGRCNVTNNCNVDTLISNVANKNGKFLYSAFSSFTPKDLMDFLQSQNVPLKTERGNRVFPVSDKAVDIVDGFVNAAKKSGVKFKTATVNEIIANQNKVIAVKAENEIIECDSVILATGGLSYPLTGSTGDGYKMAEKLGHTITALKPSLVPLNIHEGFCSRLSGLSLKNVNLSVFEEDKKKPIYSEQGEMLFTHFGISGPLVLSASSHIRYIDKKKYVAFIDLKPALTFEQLDARILRDFAVEQNKDYANSLSALLPKSLIPVIVKLSQIEPNKKVNQISKEERFSLCNLIKALPLHITGFRPIEEAIITSGGISVKEIAPKTMASKLIDGLYFAGEIIDVDSYTGGFNLQIAFSTGFVAGKNA